MVFYCAVDIRRSQFSSACSGCGISRDSKKRNFLVNSVLGRLRFSHLFCRHVCICHFRGRTRSTRFGLSTFSRSNFTRWLERDFLSLSAGNHYVYVRQLPFYLRPNTRSGLSCEIFSECSAEPVKPN